MGKKNCRYRRKCWLPMFKRPSPNTPITPNMFSLLNFPKFLSNKLELCADEVDVLATFYDLFTDLMDRFGWEACSKTLSLLKIFCCLFHPIIRRIDNILKTRWMHYKWYRRTSIPFETWNSRASTGSTFAFHQLELLVLSRLQSVFQFC